MVGRGGGGDKRSVILAGLSAAIYVGLALTVTGPRDTLLWLGGYSLLWLLYALWLAGGTPSESAWPFILLFAFSARLVWVATPVWLSDDLYRYLLDGQVLAAGINPFRYAPAHPVIQALAPELAAQVNHPSVPTIYPATVQLMGWVAAILGFGVNLWRAMVAIVDVLALPLIASAFGGGAEGRRAASVYGLCPLAIVEAGANGHVEAFTVVGIFGGIALLRRRSAVLAAFAFAAAALTKLFPLLLAPLLAGHARWKRVAFSLLAFTAAGLMIFSWGGVDPTVGLRSYLDHWSFNGPVYQFLNGAGLDDRLARGLPVVLFLAGGVVARQRGVSALRAAPWLIFVFLLCSPTLHPWYALWLLPWLGARPHAGLLAFVFAMGLSYVVWWRELQTGQWSLSAPDRVAIWGVVLAGFVVAWLRGRDERGRDSAAAAC